MADRPTDDLGPGEKLVAQGAKMIQIENDQMRAIAKIDPRDPTGDGSGEIAIRDKALAILQANPDAVAAAYYSIPYKKHRREGDCTGLADDNCPVEHEVEGIGIDGARELARLWRNNVSRVIFADEDEDWVQLIGIFVDLETNARVELPYQVSKYGFRRGGGAYTLDQRQLRQEIQAGISKAARNAIVHALPRWLSRAYYERAKTLLVGSGSIEIPKLLESFAEFRVSRETLEAYYGCRLEEMSKEQRRNLRATYVAISNRLIDPAEHFAGTGGGGAESPRGTGSDSTTTGVTPPSPVTGDAKIKGGTVALDIEEQSEPGNVVPIRPEQEEPTQAEPASTLPIGPEQEEASTPAEPAPAPSPATPERVESPTPNDQKQPVQGDLGDLGL